VQRTAVKVHNELSDMIVVTRTMVRFPPDPTAGNKWMSRLTPCFSESIVCESID